MHASSLRIGLWIGCVLSIAGCSDGRAPEVERGPTKTTSTQFARTLVESPEALGTLRSSSARVRGALAIDAPAAVERFELEGMRVRTVVSRAARAAVPKTASVELPGVASAETKVSDDLSGVSVRFALVGARPSPIAIASGFAVFANALDDAHLVHRVHAEGTEDWVFFAKKPASEALIYDVDVSGAPGLRLVSDTFELLDESGSPSLRIAPPFVVDARGLRHPATLAVRGCRYDTNPAAPWNRPITRPGSSRCTVEVSWRDVAYPLAVDPSWVATGSLGSPRSAHTATLLSSGKVLMAGGQTGTSTWLSTAELFDPAAAAGVGAFAATGSMAVRRFIHAASLFGSSGKVLVTGGSDGTGAISNAEIYDPGTGLFTATANLIGLRQSHTSTLLGTGKVVVIGGLNNSGTRLSTAELFDPTGGGGAGTFTSTGNLVNGRQVHAATLLLSGKVLVSGGNFSGSYTTTAELYDPAGSGTFSSTGAMAAPRCSHDSARLPSGKVLVAGGYTFAGFLSTADLYDPAAGTWATTGNLPAGTSYPRLLTLSSGLVLTIGGGQSSGPLASALLFDPAGGSGVGAFTATTSMLNAHDGHSATLFPSGRVLVAGGFTTSTTITTTAEVFTTATKINGTTCATSTECISGICTDSVCCDSTCTSNCDACDVTGKVGTCSHVTGAPHGTTRSCGVSGTCGGSCSGSSATCTYPGTGTTCGTTCIIGGEATSTCNGAGGCTPGTTAKSCGSYACVGTACKTTCTTGSDCAPGFTCAAPNCVSADAGVDSGADTTVDGSGDTTGSDTSVTDSGGTDTSVSDSSGSDSGGSDSGKSDSSLADTGSTGGTCTTPGASCGDGLTCTNDLRCVPGVPTQTGCACTVLGTHEDEDPMPAALLAAGVVAMLSRRRHVQGRRR